MHTQDLHLIQCNGSKSSCISVLFAYTKSTDVAGAGWVKSTSSSGKQLCFFSFSIARWIVHWPGGQILPILLLPKHKSWYRWIGGGQSQGYRQGDVTDFRGGRGNMKPLGLPVSTWCEWLSNGIIGISSITLGSFEQGGQQPQENLLSCNTVSLHGCANRKESAKC